ncbi:unnamed protein product [Mytilus coruscus]|uniref:FAD dependent oxidoreductase domain-containing protein n=1 Tax=Mytilus coruscus TaxID=42192 RepID=A0A6J8BXQ0_MYTCO|nr:unnamed protein product [Mytilus coruscus]
MVFDLCVVGAGCIGSAAARYGSNIGTVCLIGVKEAEDQSTSGERDIFGAHYDEGRITRSSHRDFVWSSLAKESIARYREIESSSGIPFYDEAGFIICGSFGKEFMRTNKECAKSQGINTKLWSSKELKEHFPYLNFSESDEAIYENDNSGYISPRRLIEAQITIAKRQGCHVIEAVANEVERCVIDGEYLMCVSTESGQKIYAKKVLLATGAFTSFRKLLPKYVNIDVSLRPITVARIEISLDDYKKISNMPSISYCGTGAADWMTKFIRKSDNTVNFYMLPPVKYPDGKYYIKLGHDSADFPKILSTATEVKHWYCSRGDEKMIEDIVTIVKDIVKGPKLSSYVGDCCVIVKTPSGRPYIDHIHSQLGIAVGGNGYAAKSCDEIGRLAALLVLKNKWDTTLPKDSFTVKYKTEGSKL